MPLMCDICINSSEMVHVQLQWANGKWLCNDCYEFVNKPNGAYDLDAQLQSILLQRKPGKHSFLLAYSGGLDSCASLKFLVEELDIKPLVLCIDNGLKNKAVWSNVYSVVDHYDLDIIIHEANITDLISKSYPPGTIFCGQDCNNLWKYPALKQIVYKYDYPFVLTGNEIVKEGRLLRLTNPPTVSLMAARPMARSQRQEYISDLPWRDPGIMGYDTDCLYAGWALDEYRKIHGKWPRILIDWLSARIRWGFLDRQQELDYLQNWSLNRQQRQFVETRCFQK